MSFQVIIGSLGGTVFFQVGFCTPLRIMNLHDIYTTLALKKMMVEESVSKNLPKNAMKLGKFPHSCWGGGGGGGGSEGARVQFLQKKPNLNLKCLTTKTVDNFFFCHY